MGEGRGKTRAGCGRRGGVRGREQQPVRAALEMDGLAALGPWSLAGLGGKECWEWGGGGERRTTPTVVRRPESAEAGCCSVLEGKSLSLGRRPSAGELWLRRLVGKRS